MPPAGGVLHPYHHYRGKRTVQTDLEDSDKRLQSHHRHTKTHNRKLAGAVCTEVKPPAGEVVTSETALAGTTDQATGVIYAEAVSRPIVNSRHRDG